MTTHILRTPPLSAATQTTLGIVSFLNSVPLACGLDDRPNLTLRRAVPSALCEMLLSRGCDAALLPIVDYHRYRDALSPLSDACIASDGETLTVRVFSTVPAERVTRLRVDNDSHTSIALAQIIWQELYNRRVELVASPHQNGDDPSEAEAVLLIGDKVIRSAPRGYGFIVDLGAAWKHLTGLPFVFAAWYSRKGEVNEILARELEAARDEGVRRAESLATGAAADHDWPVEAAIVYLRDIMKYTLTPPMRAGMDRFFELMDRHGLSS